MKANKRLYIVAFAAAGAGICLASNELALQELILRLEKDVRDLADAVERAYEGRCTGALDKCYANNYDTCLSKYPDESCPGGDQLFTIPECGDGITCGGIFDFTVSSVDLPKNVADGKDGNPTDPLVVETVCYTQQLDEWFLSKYEADLPFWDERGIDSPWMYFGALDGTFRIFPARHSKVCGEFDPQTRPWFVAGSSGKKDIVLVLDTSGSMQGYTLDLLKQAATRIVRTLTIGDRVSIVRFGEDAQIVADSTIMIPATKENKEKLVEEINLIQATGKTNFYDAFTLAFDSLNRTIGEELNSGCNAAILFFTDGKMTHPDWVTEQMVIAQVKSGKAEIEKRTNRKLSIFTYSLGDDDVHTLPHRIACEAEGLWTKINDERELVDRMSSYYKLFSFGLGDGKNDDFVAWVDPYKFATGDEFGTTVSAPVYDRSLDPPLFLGVVGIDFTLDAMKQAYEAGHNETLKAVVRQSTASCPKLSFPLCHLESLRKGAGGEEALCARANCTAAEFIGIEPQTCPAVDDYPKNLWKNTDNKGKTFEDQVCCKVGKKGTSDQCPLALGPSPATTEHLTTGALIGVVIVAAVVGLVLFMACVYFYIEKPISCNKKPSGSSNAGSVEMEVRVLPPPILPPPTVPETSASGAE